MNLHGERERERERDQFIDDRANGDGRKPAGEGVGDESADERREVGGSAEVGECVGGLHEWHVKLLG